MAIFLQLVEQIADNFFDLDLGVHLSPLLVGLFGNDID